MNYLDDEDGRSEWDWLADMASLALVFIFCVIVAVCFVGVYWMYK